MTGVVNERLMREVTDVFRGRNKMGRWRGKILFTMIVYAAGFLTAIYVLAPSAIQSVADGNGLSGRIQDETTQRAGFDGQAWAASARAGMNKAIAFAEEQALHLAEQLKTSMQQSTPEAGK